MTGREGKAEEPESHLFLSSRNRTIPVINRTANSTPMMIPKIEIRRTILGCNPHGIKPLNDHA